MLRLVVASSALCASASALVVNPKVPSPVAPGPVVNAAGGNAPLSANRRQILSAVGAAALMLPGAAFANTMPELEAPQAGFDAAAEKRKKFQEKQKAFKKAWRKQLSNLEFAETDAEATEAIEALIKLIYENGNEIPEGVRKMDLDQVYKNVKGKLAKETRMTFAKLDTIVQKIVTVKPMGDDFDLGY